MDLLKLLIRVISDNGDITDEVKYFSAFEEGGKVIAQLDNNFINNNKLEGDHIPARRSGEFTLVTI